MTEFSRSLIQLPHDAEGILRARPNRYLGIVDLPGQSGVEVHIHDPGRLTELLWPGNRVLLKRISSAHRKTGWDVLAAWHANQWVLVHAGHHRKIAEALLQSDSSPFTRPFQLRAEVRHANSRLDFLLTNTGGGKIWIEVKGCTLAVDRVALFPDAPTVRGSKHLQSLIQICAEGQRAGLLILIFRQDVDYFKPNIATDPVFAENFWLAVQAGVAVHPVVLEYLGGEIRVVREVGID